MGNVNYTSRLGAKLIGAEVGAWLADNTPGTVGCSLDQVTNKVINGTFDTDTAWTKAATWTIASGVATSSGGLGDIFTNSNVGIVPGRTYKATLEVTAYTSGGVRFNNSGGITAGTSSPTLSSTGTLEHVFTPTADGILLIYSDSFVGSIDNVTITEYCAPNLLTHPENFGHADWVKVSATVTENQSIGYDGSLSMDEIADISESVVGEIYQAKSLLSTNAYHVGFVFLKAGTSNIAEIELVYNGVSTKYGGVVIDLSTGNIVNRAGTLGAGAPDVSGVVNFGGGVYRLWCGFADTGSNTSVDLRVRPAWNTVLSSGALGSALGSVYAGGAQLTETAELQGYGSSHDISSNDHALQVAGELTKTPVATGSGLQAWSGFTANDYLFQPYDAALDFGTGDFFASGWFNESSNTTFEVLFSRGAYSAGWSGSLIQGFFNANGTIRFYISDDGAVTSDQIDTPLAYDDSVNHYIVFLRTGANFYIYIDGVQVGTTPVSNAAGSLSNASATVFIGLGQDGASTLENGSLSLFKIGSGSLTPAQIKSIYDQEKELFRTYTAMQIEGQEYDLTLSLSTANRSEPETSYTSQSIEGQKETIFHRSEVNYNLLINRITSANLPDVRAFLQSVRGRASFSFDRYGTGASPDDPRLVEADPGFQESRNGVDDYYTISLRVNEVI